ncbi:MAG: NUDIX domain-containing protein [Tetrasphaera sp.]
MPIRVTAAGDIEVFIAHMGGPLWARKDDRAWSIVKGEFDPATESARDAALREWAEETGAPVPQGGWFDLGVVKQSGGKTVHAFAVLTEDELSIHPEAGEPVTMEWPPRSGRTVSFAEIDRAEWCAVDVARTRLVAAQAGFLDRLDVAR